MPSSFQGLALDCTPLDYVPLEHLPDPKDISSDQPPVWIILDEVMDPVSSNCFNNQD